MVFAGSAVQADTIYNNSTNDLKVRFDTQALEVGDEIVVAGSARFLTNFSFEYWGTATAPGAFAGNVEVRVRFYQNDGAEFNGYAGPGTMFYDSGWFGVAPTPRNVLGFTAGTDFPAEGLLLPPGTNFTWSAQFQGLGTGDAAGVDIYSPIIVGQGFPDYWQRDQTGWQLMTNYTSPMNFAAVFLASETAAAPPSIQIRKAINDTVALSWPAWATSYKLESSPVATGGTWTPITDTPYQSSGRLVLTNAPASNPIFYRLRIP